MEDKKITDFDINEKIQGFYLIKASLAKVTQTNKNFLDITLADTTGEINAKLWDCTEEDIANYVENSLVKVRGDVTEWQGKPQLKIERIRLATEDDGVEIEDYVPSAPEKGDVMYEEIMAYVGIIKNDDIRKIVQKIYEDDRERLLYYPAAKSNHHAIRSGLLYHIKRMLMTAERLVQVYENIDSDLLFAGVLLHDIAKLDEMDASELGIVSEYSSEGKLLGHIIQGIKRIERVAKEVGADGEIAMVLEHMVLSHHYEPEFGSPRKPMLPEAELLHHIDIIDARMYDMEKAVENVEAGGFSERIWSLDRREIYKPKGW